MSQYSRNSGQPRSEKGLSANSVDLDASRLSAGSFSSVSTVTLGGCSYPIGSTVGSSGLFVIGDPSSGTNKRPRSTVSNTTSHSIRHLIVSQGYDFEDWNWPVIRFSFLVLLIAVMIGLLGAVIVLTVQTRNTYAARFEWWQGSVIYRIPVPEFYDSAQDEVGDFLGIEEKIDYFKYLGISVISLTNALPSFYPFWHITKAFNLNDGTSPLGNWNNFRSLTGALHRENMHVLLEMNASYTSTEHEWFQESRFQNADAGNIYTDFYVWQYQPQTPTYLWEYDVQRNEYYLHDNDTLKPVLNWASSDLQDMFKEELDVWLINGIDGLYIADLEHFYGTTTSKMITIISGWRYMLESYSQSDDRKVLMIANSYLEWVRQDSPQLLDAIVEQANLVDYPFSLQTNNLTYSLVEALNKGSQLQSDTEDPWVSWRWANMSQIPMGNWTAIEMLLMSLPGTPCITAGQEVGRVPEPDLLYYAEGRLRPLQWSTGLESYPYQTSSTLFITTLGPLLTTIRVRQEADAMRTNYDPLQDGGKRSDYAAYLVQFLDQSTFLLKRHYGTSHEYYITADLSWVSLERDWSVVTSSGQVVTDSTGLLSGSMRFDDISMERGQAILLKVLK